MTQNPISQEEKDEFLKKHNAEMDEIYRLNEKVKEYTKRIKKKDFNLLIQWETDINAIDLGVLFSPFDESVKKRLLTDFVIVNLDLDKVVGKIALNPDKIYSKEKLWDLRTPTFIARLIELVENNQRIIPPMIEPIEMYNQIAVVDGNHRIALSRFMKLDNIPFLIESKYIELVKDLN